MKLLLAGDQPGRLLLAFLVAIGDRAIELPLLFDQLLMPAYQLFTDFLQFLPLLGQLDVGLVILLGQLRSDAAQRSGQRGRRRGAGKLRPKFLRRQADFQRLALHPT